MSEVRKVGDICEACRERWEKRKLPPKQLVELPTTTELGLKIIVCPFCDGAPIVAFSSNPDNKFIPEPDKENE